MNLHLGCGDIYLEGFINIDIKGFGVKQSGLELDRNKTTLDKYFKYSFGTPRRPVMVDSQMNLTKPWYEKYQDVDQIVMISCLEHFSKQEGAFIVSEVKRVLRPGGKFLVSVPDVRAQIEMYHDSDPEWCMELLYCNGKDVHSFHKWGYTEESFKKLWGKNYTIEKVSIIKHAYPMLQFEVTKLKSLTS